MDRLTTFEGTNKQIADAKALIEQVIEEGSTELMAAAPGGQLDGHKPSGNYQEDEIDPHKVKVVIGIKGATVGMIVKKSGCKIQLNQKFPAGCMHKIEYSGTPAQIETARYLVNVVVTQGDDALKLALEGVTPGGAPVDNFVMQEMNIFQSQMLELMGTHGSNVNEVQWRCSVKIEIDTTPVMLPTNNIGPNGLPEPCNKVTVVGTSEGVQMAVKLLYEYIGIHIEAPPSAIAPIYPPHNQGYGAPPQFGGPQYGAPVQNGYYPPQQAPYGAPQQVPYGAPQQAPYGVAQQGYGAPQQQAPYGQPAPYGAPQAQAVYQAPPQAVAEPRSSTKAATLALGEDGKAGELEAAVKQADGSYQQVAVMKNNAIGRLQGRNSANIELIKSKSGANVTVAPADNSKATTKVFLTGTNQMVALASQMIQEVLVNGVGKLQQMIDVPRAQPAPSTAPQQDCQQQQIQQQQPQYVQPAVQQAPFQGMPPAMGQPQPGYYPPQQQQMPPHMMSPQQGMPMGLPGRGPAPMYGGPHGMMPPQQFGQPGMMPGMQPGMMPPHMQQPQYGGRGPAGPGPMGFAPMGGQNPFTAMPPQQHQQGGYNHGSGGGRGGGGGGNYGGGGRGGNNNYQQGGGRGGGGHAGRGGGDQKYGNRRY